MPRGALRAVLCFIIICCYNGCWEHAVGNAHAIYTTKIPVLICTFWSLPVTHIQGFVADDSG